MSKQAIIYSLVDPRSGGVRYIGKTVQVPRRRLGSHLRDDKSTEKGRWVQRLKGLRLHPTLEILEWVADDDSWQEREKWWISWGVMCGWDLTNLTSGGDGPPTGRVYSEKALKKMSLRVTGEKNPMYGKRASPEARKRMSAAGAGKPKSKEHNLAVSRAKRGKPLSEKHRYAGTRAGLPRRKIDKSNHLRGEESHKAKLTEREVVEIRQLYDSGQFSQRVLARQYAVGRSNIGNIVNRKTWRSVLPRQGADS